MTDLDHERILKLIGVMTDENRRPVLITEFMVNGDLGEFLRNDENVSSIS